MCVQTSPKDRKRSNAVARLEFAGSELYEKVLPHRVGARQLVHRARQPVEGMDLHPHDHEDHTILP